RNARGQEGEAGTTFSPDRSNVRSKRPPRLRDLPRRFIAILFGTALQRIWSNAGSIFEPFKRSQVNAPVVTTILTDQDLIQVLDPTHPLFGRQFQVVRLCALPRGEGFVDVSYREHIRLRIPLNATDRATSVLAQRRTKVTLEGVQQLIALAKECQESCRDNPPSSGDSLRNR